MDDRRNQPRKSVDMILNGYQDGAPGLLRASDMSATGMRVRRILGPRKRCEDPIDLELQLPEDHEVLFIHGEPVHQSDDGREFGIRFVGLPERIYQKVLAFVEGTRFGRPLPC